MYINPILFLLNQIFSWNALLSLASAQASDYPIEYTKFDIVLFEYSILFKTVLIQTVISGAFVIMWIIVALKLINIRPRAVSKAKNLLIWTAAWTLIDMCFFSILMTEYVSEYMIYSATRSLFSPLIFVVIWYFYFCKSKRIKATYPLN